MEIYLWIYEILGVLYVSRIAAHGQVRKFIFSCIE